MSQYTLLPEEKESYHLDEVRATIRQRASAQASSSETIQILDEDGNLFDTLNGSQPGDDDLAVPLSEEDLEKRRLELAEIERLEVDVKPKVMRRLLTQARNEVREQLRDRSSLVLQQSAQIANMQSVHRTELDRLKAQNIELRAQVSRLKQATKDTVPPTSEEVQS